MALILSIVSYKGQPVAPPREERFSDGVVTVGRTPGNKLVLPDPESFVSKQHCAITVQGSVCQITDQSSNGTFINLGSEPLGRDRSAVLHDGDRLRMGEYELVVRIAPSLERPQPPVAKPTAGAPGPASDALAVDPFGLSDLVAPQAAPPRPALSAAPAGLDDLLGLTPASGTPTGGNAGVSPFDLDALFPNDPLPDPPVSGAGAEAPLAPSDPQWPFPPAAPTTGWPNTPSDHTPPEQQFFQPPRVAPTAIPEDWDPFAPIAPSRGPAPAPASTAGEHTRLPGQAVPASEGFGAVPPPGQGPLDSPPFDHRQAGAATNGPAFPATPGPGGDLALLRAFLDGAGLPATAVGGEDPLQAMRRMGALVREMAAGLVELLATRSMVKAEYRLEHTQIGARNNNPFKVAPSAEEVMSIILGPSRPGYMPGPRAVQEGFRDVKAHELALMAGMQAAAAALLRQFDPQSLTQRLDKTSLLRSLVPGARKAKYWETYEQQYRQIVGEVSESVRGIFGRAFAQAYEEQIKKL
jgi:type VI secretion system protein